MTNKTPMLLHYSAAQLLAMRTEPREWVITNLLRDRQMAMLYAPTGVGKSWLGMSLACLAAGGGSMYRFTGDKPASVLYIDGEMDLEDLRDRLKVCIAATGADMKKVGENLILYSRQAQDPRTPFLNLDDAGDRERLMQLIQKHAPQFIVLDNFSTLVEVEDENSASAFNGITNLLLTLKQDRRAALLVHHSRKGSAADTSSYRGSSRLSVTFDVIIKALRPDDAPTKGCTVEVVVEKDRSAQIPHKNFKLYLEHTSGARWQEQESSDQLHRLVSMIKSCNYKSNAEVAKAMNLDKSTVGRKLSRAIGLGLIDKDAAGQYYAKARAAEDLVSSYVEAPEEATEVALENPEF